MMAQAIDIVTITLRSESLGMKRRKSPILSPGEKSIRRRAAAGRQRERVAFAPDIVAVAVHSQREIQVERGTAMSRFLAKAAHLFISEPLDIEMILPGFLLVIAGLQHAIAGGLGPMLPRQAL